MQLTAADFEIRAALTKSLYDMTIAGSHPGTSTNVCKICARNCLFQLCLLKSAGLGYSIVSESIIAMVDSVRIEDLVLAMERIKSREPRIARFADRSFTMI